MKHILALDYCMTLFIGRQESHCLLNTQLYLSLVVCLWHLLQVTCSAWGRDGSHSVPLWVMQFEKLAWINHQYIGDTCARLKERNKESYNLDLILWTQNRQDSYNWRRNTTVQSFKLSFWWQVFTSYSHALIRGFLSAFEVFQRDVLYKSTFYLLTYLLTERETHTYKHTDEGIAISCL